jgi:gluconate kinase
MPATLLDSQFAALEAPSDALVVDVAKPVEQQVGEMLAAYHLERVPAP